MLPGIMLAPDSILKPTQIHGYSEKAISRSRGTEICSRGAVRFALHRAAQLQRFKLIPFAQRILRSDIAQEFVRGLAFAFGILANEMIVSGTAAI